MNIFVIISLIICSIIHTAFGLFEYCDNSYTVYPNQNPITIYSPNYNGKYSSGSSCRYSFNAPAGYQITVQCSINLDTANGACSTEYFYIATDGNIYLTNANYYCGNGPVTQNSISNNLVIAYTSTSQSGSGVGGSFTCQITACDCGWNVNTRIVGGTETYANQYTPMAALIYLGDSSLYCGATIIASRYILTAAHCSRLYGNPADIGVLVGDQNYLISSDTQYSALYYVETITEHPQFDSATYKNDIAVLRTASDIVWSKGVGPACLPFSYASTSFVGSTVQASGWGTTAYSGPDSPTLLYTNLNVTSTSYCDTYYPNIDATQLCTYTPNSDTCQKDSGGPLWFQYNRLYIVGVVSYGTACATNYPSVNTRVTSFIPWIQSVTPEIAYCRR